VDRADEPRLGPVLAELAPDARHVRVDDATARVVAVAPDAVHQLLATEDDAGLAGEREQDLELERGELHLLAVDAHLAFGRVDREPGVFDRVGRGWRRDAFDAPQDRLDPDGQLSQAERLGQVVVRAHREPGHLVGFLGPRREHQDRDPAPRLEPAAHLEAVHPGEHQVEHDQVGFLGARQLQRLRAVGRDQDPEPLAREPRADGLGDRRFVIHDQDGLLGHRPIVAVGPSRPSGRVLRNRGGTGSRPMA
jgi:hypothetical protein